MIPRLGVNIDHVATLRQARGTHYPSLVDAARLALEAGADQITIHLREDRRHIQDPDVSTIKLVVGEFGKPLNLEMGCTDEIMHIALEVAPEWVCLVPEKREEQTTEGGLDLLNPSNLNKIKVCCERLKKTIPQTKISLFLGPSLEVLERAVELPIDAVEVHTGDYARAFLNGEDLTPFFQAYTYCKKYLEQRRLGVHAGHGLTQESVIPLLENKFFVEYNIGHWIICEAVLKGLFPVVKELKEKFNENR